MLSCSRKRGEEEMKRRKIIVSAVLALAVILLVPAIMNMWHQRQLSKHAAYLAEICRHITRVNVERESAGLPRAKGLEEVIDGSMRARMEKDGVDWRGFHYFPLDDDAPDSAVLLSVAYADYCVEVRKGGAMFRRHKKMRRRACRLM